MPPPVMADNKTNGDTSLTEEKCRKERLLDEKMRLIRQKNEERLKRQREIEEDIRNANSHGEETANRETDVKAPNKMSGVMQDKPASKFRGRARGRILEKMSKEKPQAQRFKERQKANYELVEKELKEEKTTPGRGFLSDDRRVDMSRVASRSTNSWGGSQFEDVIDKVKKDTRHGNRRDRNIDINMTGKERLKYQEWKEEQQKVDQARQSRQKRGDTWQREWDKCKAQSNSGCYRERQHHDRTRGGQRTRRKPDWDLHDDRVDEETHANSIRSQNNQNQTNHHDTSQTNSSEDWEVDQNKQLDGKNGTAINSATINNEEDWGEETIETQVNIQDESNSLIVSHSVTEASSGSQTTVNIDNESKLLKNDPEIDTSHSQTVNVGKKVENFTVTVDPQGSKNIKEPSSANTESEHGNLQENASTTKQESAVTDDDKVDINVSVGSNTSTASTDNTDKNKTPAKNDEVCTKEESIKNVDTSKTEQSTTEDDITHNDTTSDEQPTTEESIANKDNLKDEEQPTTKDTVQHDKTIKDTKPKSNVPELDLTKAKEEPVPDFLKTPQHKDWADYDFDEEEVLDFSQDLLYYSS